jgi:hypothetical protein
MEGEMKFEKPDEKRDQEALRKFYSEFLRDDEDLTGLGTSGIEDLGRLVKVMLSLEAK